MASNKTLKLGYNASTNTYDTLNDLRLAIGQSSSSITVLGQNNPYDSKGGTFLWDNTSILPDDNYTIIKPTLITSGGGRWIRANSADALSGRIYFTGDGVTSSFTYTLPLEYSFLNNDYTVVLQPVSISAIRTTDPSTGELTVPNVNYVSSKSTNSFNVVFTNPPPITTMNAIQFDYIIRYTPNILEL